MITLFPTYILGDLRLTSYPYAVEFGGDHGAPETITELAQSLLADGDIVRVTRHGNREISLVVHVEGASLAELAENEAALRRECAKVENLLTFEPGDPLGSPASVFEVQVAEMRHARDDDQESHLLRRWEVTLTCSPFARSEDLVTVAALVAGSSTFLVDDCDSAVGWTATRNGNPDVATTFWESGSVGVAELDAAVGNAPETWALTRAGSVDLSVTPFLVVEARVLGTRDLSVAGLSASADSAPLPAISVRKLDDLYSQVIFDAAGLAGGVASSLTFTVTTDDPNQAWQGLLIRNVDRSDIPPSFTPRQMTRIIEAGGTERTPASIHIEDTSGTDSLGLVIVHTSPEDGSGYAPPLRRWRVAGGEGSIVAASDTFSGSYEPMNPSMLFRSEIPVPAIPPGDYGLVVALKSDTAGTFPISWSAQTVHAAGILDDDPFSGSTAVTFFLPNVWHFASLTPLTLPTVEAGNEAVVRIDLQYQESGPETIILDDGWVFRLGDDCALTVVSSTPKHLWLDSPGVSSGSSEVRVGYDVNRSDAWHPGSSLFAGGTHVLSPGGTAIFTASRDVDYPKVDASFYRRWHSNAGA